MVDSFMESYKKLEKMLLQLIHNHTIKKTSRLIIPF